MAIRAKADITISRIIDIKSVTRYYLLQSSSSASPTKPTTNPRLARGQQLNQHIHPEQPAHYILLIAQCLQMEHSRIRTYLNLAATKRQKKHITKLNLSKRASSLLKQKYLRTRRLHLCAQPKQKLAIYRSAVGIISQHEGRRFLMRMASSPSLIIRVKGHLRNSTILLYR